MENCFFNPSAVTFIHPQDFRGSLNVVLHSWYGVWGCRSTTEPPEPVLHNRDDMDWFFCA
eukprot:979679-Amphidinium_carterae.2